MTAFWQNFNKLCERYNVKPSRVASEIGLKSTGTISAWKTKDIIPNKNTLALIAEYFNVTIADLLAEPPEEPTSIHMTLEQLDFSARKLPPEKIAQIEQYAEFITGQKVKISQGKAKPTLADIRNTLDMMLVDFEKKQNSLETEANLKSFPETEETEKIS